jgi:hypothetical protein
VVEILSFCWKSLHLYGKKSDDFEGLVTVYLGFLGKYPAQKVHDAFEKYIKNRREFPTPSDIIGIIEGRVKRDANVYRNLLKQRKEGVFLGDDEHRYIREYERETMEDWG